MKNDKNLTFNNINLPNVMEIVLAPYTSEVKIARDITEELEVTIHRVVQERDASKKTSDQLLVAYFKEPEIRKGEKLKPMVINATNAKMINSLAGSPFIEDWVGVSTWATSISGISLAIGTR